ncbi:fascin-2-like [Scleropages formosus]|uniref:Fascin-2 n=1 Tax=Scleropages formosus TaxID=113540 RepID=A0A0P7V890_SCLFO|nr:fascin-2-like [Scleropages formosus]
MPTNGTNTALKLQFGLINHENRYLTAEAFGFKVNASAPSMKKKQIWMLEQDEQDSQVMYLRSHLGRYLASDKDGKVSCGAEKPETDCRFLIVAQSDGRWALQSEPYLRYFGGSEDYLRKRYAHLSRAEGEISVDSNIPWGVDSLLTLAYLDGRYCLKTSDNRFLNHDGKLVMESSRGTSYTLELKAGKLAFKDCEGKYLTPMGPTGTLRSGRCSKPGKDELFELEESHPQVVFQAANNRFVSIRQGQNMWLLLTAGSPAIFVLECPGINESVTTVTAGYQSQNTTNGGSITNRSPLHMEKKPSSLNDRVQYPLYVAAFLRLAYQPCLDMASALRVSVSANQDDETDMETFQMEIDKETRKCMFRTKGGNYWTLVSHGGIQSTATEVAANTMFEIEWLGRRVALRASNGKYVCTKKNGQLAAVSETEGENEQFLLKLINRPILILRGENGFVCHHRNSNTLDANRSIYDIFTLHFSDGAYHIKGANGRFWYVSSSGLVCSDGDTPEDFFVEFLEHGHVGIKGKNGKYLRGDQGGTLKGDGDTVDLSTLWEY